MQWINIHVSAIESPAFVHAKNNQIATWIRLIRYCYVQENGGFVQMSKTLPARIWRKTCQVSLSVLKKPSDLWSWHDDGLEVAFYMQGQEAKIKTLVANAAIAGSKTTPAKAQAARYNGQLGGRPRTQETQPTNPTQNPTDEGKITQQKERKGKEREGNARAREAPHPPDFSTGGNPGRDRLAALLGRGVNTERSGDAEWLDETDGQTPEEILAVLGSMENLPTWAESEYRPAREAWEAQQAKRDQRDAEDQRELARASSLLAELDALPEKKIPPIDKNKLIQVRAWIAGDGPDAGWALPDLRKFLDRVKNPAPDPTQRPPLRISENPKPTAPEISETPDDAPPDLDSI